MLKSALKRALGLGTAVVEGARIEGESTIVSARPRRAALRCPACGRRCDGCDTLPARRWRAPNVGSARCCVECAPRRVERPEHGVRAEAVPWARAAPSRFASAFEDTVAWLALHMCRNALAELMRVDWRTVGGICARVEADLEARDGRGRLDGLRRIGVDETSCKRGHRYMTVVVDHDRGRVVRACEGHGKRQLNDFLDHLTDVQRGSIEVAAADGARWIADVVAGRLPGAELARGPVPRGLLGDRGARRPPARGVAGGPQGPAPQAGAGQAAQGRGGPRGLRQGGQGPQAPAAQEPRGPQRGAGLGARGRRCGADTCSRRG